MIDAFPPTALRRRHAQMVRDSHSTYKIDYVIGIKNFLNPKGHQNLISGSKVTTILLKWWILPIGGVASGRVCGRSSFFFLSITNSQTQNRSTYVHINPDELFLMLSIVSQKLLVQLKRNINIATYRSSRKHSMYSCNKDATLVLNI